MQNSTAHGAFMGTARFGSLDGLRCLAVLQVVWGHGPGIAGYRGYGRVGLHLLLALSGFLITIMLLRERQRTGSISIRKFYARRVLRIFPLYYVVFFGYLAAVLAFGRHLPRGAEFLANAPYFATYTINWYHTGSYNILFGHAWSLAVQEQFYLVWPLLLVVLPSRAAVGALALGLVSTRWLGGSQAPPGIFWGALVAFALHSARGFALCWPVFGHRYSALVAAALMLATVLIHVPPVVQALLAAALMTACVIREDNVLATVLQWRPLTEVGVIGYGFYLLHLPISSAVSRVGTALSLPLNPHEIPSFFVVLAITFPVAFLSYRYFETPFMNLRERFSTR